MIESLKSVQEALEREKVDLQDQAEQLDEALIESRTELLQVKGQVEVQETTIEELKEEKEQSQFELTDTKVSLNMQVSTNETLESKIKMIKDAHESDTATKSSEIEDLKKTLADMQNLTFLKEKNGDNALGDSEVQDGNELQELEKEHSSIMEANNDFDDAVSSSTMI